MAIPSMGSTLDEILTAFNLQSRNLAGIKIVEAEIVAGSLWFRLQGNGKLGIVLGGLFIREAKPDEIAELEDAIELGQAQIYTTPLYVSGRDMQKTILHQATGIPLDPNSTAARQQQERLARAYPEQAAHAPADGSVKSEPECWQPDEDCWRTIIPADLASYPPAETVVLTQVQHWRTNGIQEHQMIRVVEDDVAWRTADDRSEFDERNWSVIAWRLPKP